MAGVTDYSISQIMLMPEDDLGDYVIWVNIKQPANQGLDDWRQIEANHDDGTPAAVIKAYFLANGFDVSTLP